MRNYFIEVVLVSSIPLLNTNMANKKQKHSEESVCTYVALSDYEILAPLAPVQPRVYGLPKRWQIDLARSPKETTSSPLTGIVIR